MQVVQIVNRIKAQLSLAAAAQRQINQRNAAMISQKANLLRNFQMESSKAQSKFRIFHVGYSQNQVKSLS